MNETNQPTINVQHTYQAGAIIYQVQGPMHVEHHHQAPSYFGTPSETQNAAPSTSEADVLLKYCPEREQCSTIAAMLRGCTRASQLVTGLLNIDSKGWIEWNEMNTTDFRSDILPLLGFETSESAIKMAMHRRS